MVEPNLAWKDTVLVRTGETVDILLDVTNPGRWMAHCHIAEHHESGMMFSFNALRPREHGRYCAAGPRRVAASSVRIGDGLNPLKVSQMPSDSSQMNSGKVAMPCPVAPWSKTPNMTAIPEAHQRACDEPQHGQGSWHQAGSVHQVAQQEPVPHADDEAGPRMNVQSLIEASV